MTDSESNMAPKENMALVKEMDTDEALDASHRSTPDDASERRVRFGKLHIRQYPMIAGDNPAVTMGCPLTIAWEFDGEVSIPIDEYEEARPPSRSMIELRMPSSLRESILQRLGFSRREITEHTKMANIARNRRKRTEETMQLAPLQELLEKAKRGTLNMTVKRGSKQKERKMLKTLSQRKGLTLDRNCSLRGSSDTATTLDTTMFTVQAL